MARKLKEGHPAPASSLARFACPNPNCAKFNCFGAGTSGKGRGQGRWRVVSPACGYGAIKI
jgi:hypothetical protein